MLVPARRAGCRLPSHAPLPRSTLTPTSLRLCASWVGAGLTGGRAYRALLRGKQVVVAKRLHSGDVVDARELLAHARAGHHPHVVTLLGVAVDTPKEHADGGTGVPAAPWGGNQGHGGVCSTYIVMEHVERGSLAQVLAKHGPVTRMRHLMK